MTRICNRIFFYFILLLVLQACSNTKHLPEGETLFIGSNTKIVDRENTTRKQQKVLEDDLNGSVRPKPNSKILGMRLKLTIYNLAGEPKKEKGLRNWLRTKVGEPPVLGSKVDMEHNRSLLENMLENKGFFYPTVTGNLEVKNRKSKAHFEVVTGKQYTIRNVEFITDSTKVSRDVADVSWKSLLKKDAPFNLDLIKAERERIDRHLKEIGYYYFTPDYIIVRVDSTIGDNKVDMYVKIKDGIPEEAKDAYLINNVFIYPNFRMNDDRVRHRDSTGRMRRGNRNADTLFYERYYIVGNTKLYKPFVFTQAMQFKPGEYYNRTDQNKSLNRLINMGTFKFVKNEFKPVYPDFTPHLDAYYYLTPYPKKALTAEIGASSKSDSRVGSQFSVSWRNRNTFRGAELLAVKLTAGFEAQAGGKIKRPPTYQFGIEPSLTIPRFVVPFFNPRSSSTFVPRTIFRVGYDYVLRPKLYGLQSFKGSYGFAWKEDIRKEHQLFPINITYVKTDTLNKDTTFTINYNNLIFEGLIIGPTYEYTYNSRINDPNKHDIYFNGLVDLSGNLLGVAQGAAIDEPQKNVLGAKYAQYIKLQTDLRHYMHYGVDPSAIWANRLLLGFGFPNGNSFQLPNIKQFFSGGNSSLRGFRSRLVGPGTFHEDIDSLTFIETSGDLKMEVNIEFRGKLYSFIHVSGMRRKNTLIIWLKHIPSREASQ